MLLKSFVVVALALGATANVQTGKVDPAPPGYEEYTSPIVVPSPEAAGVGEWAKALAKARKIVNKMTVPELVNMTTGAGFPSPFGCSGSTGAIPRLNIPPMCYKDGPAGVGSSEWTTAFPIGITLGATWDKELMYKRGKAMGSEFRAKGFHGVLGPTSQMVRAPAAGRNFESWGADPFISGVGMYESIRGIQDQGVIAVAKHFVANEQEHYRGSYNWTRSSSNLDDRQMHEIYAWPFAEAVRAGVGAVMCSYNNLNQTAACSNSKLLNGLLKTELDFPGFVMSDWWATYTGVDSVLAGLDMSMPGTIFPWEPAGQENPATSPSSYFGAALVEAANNGSVPMARLRDMAARVLGAWYKFGQDKNYPDVRVISTMDGKDASGIVVDEHVDVRRDHWKLAREIASAGTVLLKNKKKALPLDASAKKRWAVFGSDAAPPPEGPNADLFGANANGTLAIGWGSAVTQFMYLVDPYYAIRRVLFDARPDASVQAVLTDWSMAQTTKLAHESDTCIVFAQAKSGEEIASVDGNMGDRNNLTLWNNGDNLIKTVAADCADTVVVIHSVGAVIMEPWIEHENITAVVWANLPGQESGNAIADILFGKVNPSGRLTYTLAKKREDWPYDVLYNSSMTTPQITYNEKLLLDYRWFDAKKIKPRYEFGYGLSYTSFDYSHLRIRSTDKHNRHSLAKAGLHDDVYTVSFEVKNTGRRDGHEVSQLYLGFPKSAGEPPKVLRGFERTYIKKGHHETVTIKLNKKSLAIWDVVSQSWKVPSGKFTVYIGKSSRDIVLQDTLSI